MPYATAADAVAAWDTGKMLKAVRVGFGNQAVAWGRVMDLLRKFPPPRAGQHVVAGRTSTAVVDSAGIFTLGQFESWCWKNQVGFPPAPKVGHATALNDEKEWTAAREIAFSILREGFEMVIARRRHHDPSSVIVVKKL